MNFNENLKQLRNELNNICADAILVSMNNFFGNFENEYSGIGQISGLKTYPEFDINAIASEVLNPGQTLVVGAFSITYKSYLSLMEASKKFGFKVKILDQFPILQKTRALKSIYLIDNDRKNRISRIQNTLLDKEALLLSDSAIISWIFGIRCSPSKNKCVLPNCVAIIQRDKRPTIFKDFNFFNISKFEDIIKTMTKVEFTLDYSHTNLYFPEVLRRDGFLIKPSKTNYYVFEQIKNEKEISNMKTACDRASLAFIKTLAFAENVEKTSEIAISDFFENVLKQHDDFVSLSFDSISAFGKNTSIVHYNPNTHGNTEITNGGLFLFDAGAHFKTATTDMTRTIYRGSPSNGTKKIYTSILKSVIIFSSARFPNNTKAYLIDTFARYFVWQTGNDYKFGTGHGVGSFANVHEPPRISNNSGAEITKDIIITVEPGIYNNDFGIRLENMLLTKFS